MLNDHRHAQAGRSFALRSVQTLRQGGKTFEKLRFVIYLEFRYSNFEFYSIFLSPSFALIFISVPDRKTFNSIS